LVSGAPLRFYLTGRVSVEGARLVEQTALPGRQGRLALVYLVLERHRPVPYDELADALWGAELPPSWDRSLRVLVSKLRKALPTPEVTDSGTGTDGEETGAGPLLVSDAGCYQARLGGAWVDVEAATNAVDRAEGAWRAEDLAAAWSEATVAASVTRRPLLPGEDHVWVAQERGRLRGLRVRALEVLAAVHLARGDAVLAREVAQELVALEPLREAGHRLLMRVHVAGGDRAEALRVHQRLRTSLAEELGVDPSPETAALYRAILRDRPMLA
jgi:SARP family transcriptional regulator, regulator of embCAB operon